MTLEFVPFDKSIPCIFCYEDSAVMLLEPDSEMAERMGFFFVGLCLEHIQEDAE